MPFSDERLQIETELAIQRTKTLTIIPQKTSDGKILVKWYKWRLTMEITYRLYNGKIE